MEAEAAGMASTRAGTRGSAGSAGNSYSPSQRQQAATGSNTSKSSGRPLAPAPPLTWARQHAGAPIGGGRAMRRAPGETTVGGAAGAVAATAGSAAVQQEPWQVVISAPLWRRLRGSGAGLQALHSPCRRRRVGGGAAGVAPA